MTMMILLGVLVLVAAARPHRIEQGELTLLARSRRQHCQDLLRIRRRDALARWRRQGRRQPSDRSRGPKEPGNRILA